MPSNLTDVVVRNAKSGVAAYKLSDAHGLYLLVAKGGGKHWRFDYRFGGVRRTLSIGPYPLVSLSEAREARDQARKLLRSDIDPLEQKRLQQIEAELKRGTTFALIADELIAKMEREGRAEATLNKTRWLIDFARPQMGSRPVAEITAPEVLAVLRKIEDRGRYETARRLRSVIGSVFRYAIATGRAVVDPTYALKGALISPPVAHYAAITNAEAAGELLRAIEGYGGHPATHGALRLAPHVFVRPGELRTTEWAEIDFDAAVWSIPAAKTKMRRPLKVPMTRQAIAILRSMHELTGDGRYVFPSLRSRERPMSDNCLNGALRRLGYDNTEMTAHGFRAMACSLLNESGLWHSDAIERQLGHCDSNEVRRAYARAEYWEERVRMMTWWSNRIDLLRASTPMTEMREVRPHHATQKRTTPAQTFPRVSNARTTKPSTAMIRPRHVQRGRAQRTQH
ncbi:MAG: tyrosine-type recombinase/integrase [Caulobacteraceae bacterium]